MATFTYQNTLTVIECCVCHMDFAVSNDWDRDRRRDHLSFYCPNGHRQSYTGKSDKEQLQLELDRVNRRLASRDEDLRIARMNAETARRQAAAAKGQLTKLRKRVANGVCPDGHCKRSFTDLAEHVRTCHPDMIEALT